MRHNMDAGEHASKDRKIVSGGEEVAKAIKPASPKASPTAKAAKPRCGLCGKAGKLIRTECCGNWICDDEDKYVAFSYARNSCHRNHWRFTLCGFHHNEGHPGHWKDCPRCREWIDKTEMYVWYGTNEYNFEKLENPPSYEPTHCATCGRVVRLGAGKYSMLGEKYFCSECGRKELEKEFRAR